jgi:hypothetical protein
MFRIHKLLQSTMSTVTTPMLKICDENKDDPEVLN